MGSEGDQAIASPKDIILAFSLWQCMEEITILTFCLKNCLEPPMTSGGSYINRKPAHAHFTFQMCTMLGQKLVALAPVRALSADHQNHHLLPDRTYAAPRTPPVLPHYVQEHGTEHAIVRRFIDCGLGKINEAKKKKKHTHTQHIETKQLTNNMWHGNS